MKRVTEKAAQSCPVSSLSLSVDYNQTAKTTATTATTTFLKRNAPAPFRPSGLG
jgi:hypothetical protein